MRIFYGVYLLNLELAAALDLIRFFGEPNFFRRTHVTIRGPYEQRLAAKLEHQIEKTYSDGGRVLRAIGIGSFFFGVEQKTQNTVILMCDLPGAADVWKKPDFKDGKLHLTLYDGPSRKFALALRHTLKKYPWDFSARTTGIEVLDGKKDPTEYLQIYFHKAQSICDKLFEEEVKVNSFDLKSDLERLYLIDKVSEYIHKAIVKGRAIVN